MTRKVLRCAIGLASFTLAIAIAGCTTVSPDGAVKTRTSADDLRCTLPTNCVSSQNSTGVGPLAFAGTNVEGLAQLRASLQSFPEATVESVTETSLVAIFTTPAGFRDTVEFRVDAMAHRIDFRSQSGFGLYDFGKNRARMTAFATRFGQIAKP